jgi:hypothetical protein
MVSGNFRRKLYVFSFDSVVDVTNIPYEQFNLKRHSNAFLLVANNSYCVNDVIFFQFFQYTNQKLKDYYFKCEGVKSSKN